MKQFIKLTVLAIMLMTLPACLQSGILIKVAPDGSGTVEETFLMRKDMLQELKVMTESMEGGKQAKEADIFKEADIKNKAKDMGEGVTFVSMEKVATEKFEGYKAVYAFTNINKLKINENPGGTSEEEIITFQFEKGSSSTLIIRQPSRPFASGKEDKSVPEDVKPQTAQPEPEMAAELLKQMFEGMKIAISLEVLGSVSKTNATYLAGSRITLLELDFSRILESPKDIEKFNQAKPETVEAVKELMKDLPGIKMDFNEEIRIEFK